MIFKLFLVGGTHIIIYCKLIMSFFLFFLIFFSLFPFSHFLYSFSLFFSFSFLFWFFLFFFWAPTRWEALRILFIYIIYYEF